MGNVSLPHEDIDCLYWSVCDLLGHFLVTGGSLSPCTEETVDMWLKCSHSPFSLFSSTVSQDQEAQDVESTHCDVGVGGGVWGPWAQASHLDLQHYLQKRMNFKAQRHVKQIESRTCPSNSQSCVSLLITPPTVSTELVFSICFILL